MRVHPSQKQYNSIRTQIASSGYLHRRLHQHHPFNHRRPHLLSVEIIRNCPYRIRIGSLRFEVVLIVRPPSEAYASDCGRLTLTLCMELAYEKHFPVRGFLITPAQSEPTSRLSTPFAQVYPQFSNRFSMPR